MMNYKAIEEHCHEDSAVSSILLDEFLLQYCDDRERLTEEVLRMLQPHIEFVKTMPEEWFGYVIGQHIAFRLFREKGFARKYRGHQALRIIKGEQRDWFDFQLGNPWRFCFCSFAGSPAPKFFEMTDVCTGEEFLLFSPTMSEIIETDGLPLLSLLLISPNGLCWQTYGPIMNFSGLHDFDLLMIARQLQPGLRRMSEIPAVLNRDPIPWVLLWNWSSMPVVVHKGDEMIIHRSDLRGVTVAPEAFAANFILEQEGPVYHLELKRWRNHPHFAEGFYDTKKHLLILRAMTDRGWERLQAAVTAAGVDCLPEAAFRASAAVVTMVEQLFHRDLTTTPYEDLFVEPSSPEHDAELEKLNALLNLYFTAYNAGEEIDIDALARASGVNPADARNLINQVKTKLNK